MRAIEINAKTDIHGHLKLNYPLDIKDQNVRIIILMDESSEVDDEENLWQNAVSSNPAFDSFNDPEENIYSNMDGESFNDKR